jgi:hypothetical protein
LVAWLLGATINDELWEATPLTFFVITALFIRNVWKNGKTGIREYGGSGSAWDR